jgi:hypothetical protein
VVGLQPRRRAFGKRRLSQAVLRRCHDGNELGERQRNEVPVLTELEVVRRQVRDDPPSLSVTTASMRTTSTPTRKTGALAFWALERWERWGVWDEVRRCLSLPDEHAGGHQPDSEDTQADSRRCHRYLLSADYPGKRSSPARYRRAAGAEVQGADQDIARWIVRTCRDRSAHSVGRGALSR